MPAIDTLRYARKLREAGVPADQAEAMSDALASELVERVTTKGDLVNAVELLRTKLERGFRVVQLMAGVTLALVVAIFLWLLFGDG